MKLTKMKVAAFGAVALGMASYAGSASAQVENMTAQLITSSAITSTFVSGIDYGEYFISFVAGDTPTLRASAVTGGPPTTTQVGSVANGSQVVQITAPATQGVINVQTPAPATLQMVLSNLTDFADAGLALATVRYSTATEPVTAQTVGAFGAALPVTIVAGSTDEPVTFGGDMSVTATPADNTHTADFDVTFSY